MYIIFCQNFSDKNMFFRHLKKKSFTVAKTIQNIPKVLLYVKETPFMDLSLNSHVYSIIIS